MRRTAFLFVLTLATACGASLPEPGTPEAQALARTHVTRGQHEYNLQRFEPAIEEYRQAYDLYPTPVLLFNIGQCYRAMHDWDRAIFYYTGYLRDDPQASNRNTVQQLISECREAAARESGDAPTTGTRSR